MAIPNKKLEVGSLENSLENFKRDVLEGLSRERKHIPSIYFYDERGSELFNQITKHPDYYLTNCEIEILNKNKEKIANLFKNETLNLIELGPGEGIKTTLLIEEFLQDNIHFTYIPIDISKQYLINIKKQLENKFKNLIVDPKNKDYIEGIEDIDNLRSRRNLILFLGSSIGNFDPQSSLDFLKNIAKDLNPNDYMLIGFDLCKKDTEIMIRAYNDSDGITSAFNLNILQRMNRELKANFIIEHYKHFGTYNPNLRAMESFLISLKKQEVKIAEINKSFVFEPFEAIHVEYSHKYTLPEIQHLAMESGFEVVENFFDAKNYYVDSLWKVHG